MKWARLNDENKAIEVINFNPDGKFHPSIGPWVECPDETVGGSTLTDGVWTHPEPIPDPEPVTPEPTFRKKLTRIEFKLQFTGMERLAIRAARAYAGADEQPAFVKAALDDFFDIIEDPDLTAVDLDHSSTQEGVGFLVQAGLITAERAETILAGLEE